MTGFLLISFLTVAVVVAIPADFLKNRFDHLIRSESSYELTTDNDYDSSAIATRIGSWRPDDIQNVWELSGLFEGDIMLSPGDSSGAKTGLINKNYRWPSGIIPISIEPNVFNNYDMEIIKGAIMEYHEKTCLRFKAYEQLTDRDYVHVTGAATGCWSMVGRQSYGQKLNLQESGCVYHGVVVHEFLHAVGFYHQQSASDRDNYVQINWNNIEDGHQHNFNIYDNATITDYGFGYDYGSVMHYSRYAFSKNGFPTITPLKSGAEIGQRAGMSEKDVLKLNSMYKEECGQRKPMGSVNESRKMLEDSVAWLGK